MTKEYLNENPWHSGLDVGHIKINIREWCIEVA
jgi:hypothetical protein